MKINKTKNAINNVIFGSINKIIAILFPFIIRTIIINVLGVQYLGLNSLFSSILNILSLAELGFGTAMVYSMYEPIAKDDTETINALLNLYKKIYRIIGLVVLICGLFVMPFLKYFIKGSHPADINLYLLYSIFLLNNVISYFFFAYKTSLLSAHQKNDITSKIHILTSTMMYILQIVVLLLFKNYYIYIIFLPLSTLAMNFLTAIVTKKQYPQYFCKGEVSKEQKHTIKKQISALFLHRIGYVIQSSIDNICISAFLGLTLLGKYNNYFYIVTAIQGFITIIKQSMVAGVGNSLVIESKEENKKQYFRTLFIFAWIVGWCSVCFMCLYQPFMNVWVKQENMLPITIVICLVALFYISDMRGVTGMYKDALGMWHEDRFKPMSISVVNLIGTIISAYFGWFEGIILSTIAGYVLVGFPWETHIFFKHYMKEKPIKYYLKQLLYLIVTLVAIAITYFICSFIPFKGVPEIVAKFGICLIVPNIIFVLAYFKTSEFKQLLPKIKNNKFFKKVIGKLKKIAKTTISLLFYLVPIKKNKITFCNFAGKGYGCNPKYLAEEFLKDGKYELVWFVSNTNDSSIPEGIKKVKYGSLAHFYHLITAKLWVDNIRNNPKPIFKRKKQLYVQTWHGGIAVKGIEKDVENLLSAKYVKKAKTDGKLADFIISGSGYQTKIIERSFWFNGTVLKLGRPRDDGLFIKDEQALNNLKESLKIKGKKVILYAPTFRVNKNFYKELSFDSEKLVEAFNKRFGGEHVLALRLHPNDSTPENIALFKNVVNFAKIPDSHMALHLSDYLISDYSSMIFDYTRLGNKAFIYAADYEEYLKKERNLYFSLKESGVPFAEDFEELINLVNNFDLKKYNNSIKKLNANFEFYDNVNSSKRIKEYLVEIINTKKDSK